MVEARRTAAVVPRSARGRRFASAVAAAAVLLAPVEAQAEKMILRDGRTLEGKFSPVKSMQGDRGPKDQSVQIDHIIMCDTGLKRVFVPHRQIRQIVQGQDAPAPEEFRLKQRPIGNKGTLNNIFAIARVTPFDDFGRRTFTIASAQGNVDVIQGISRITPAWTRIDGLNYTWDMRVATSSIPRESLMQVLGKVIDRTNETHRRQLVQFLIQSQRYGDAKKEIDQLVADFPALQDRMAPIAKSLLGLQARQILAEIEVRRDAHQLRLARAMLEQFPVDGVGGEVLQTVRGMLAEFDKDGGRTKKVWELFEANLAKLSTENRRAVLPIRDEIFARRAYFQREDFPNLVRFSSRLLEQWQSVAGGGVRDRAVLASPGRRLLLKLSDRGREAIAAVASVGSAGDRDVQEIVYAFNEVLAVPDLYAEADFADVVLPPDVQELLGRPRAGLHAAEVRRLNRALLEAAYEEDVAVSQFTGLGLATLDRMEPFLQFAEDAAMSAEEKLALAINGWLLGDDFTKTNFTVAVSLWKTRQIVVDYLNSTTIADRARLLEQLKALEGASVENVSKLLANMTPPLDTPVQEVPGFFELKVPVMQGEPDLTYYVQLPPEYDPHHHYPTIVTLNGTGSVAAHGFRAVPRTPPPVDAKPEAAAPPAGAPGFDGQKKNDPAQAPLRNPTSAQTGPAPFDPLAAPPAPAAPAAPPAGAPAPADSKKADPLGKSTPTQEDLLRMRPTQIDWWAGAPDPATGARSGQSMRHGYIVIAPVWTKLGQREYGSSAREHAVVLAALRDACRRFSVDTDRVFLQGHDIGGDAVWDLALAHPDLWAGVIPVVGGATRYSAKYWGNAKLLSMYHLGGELDADVAIANGREYDRFMVGGFDCTINEYRGRGHEHFMEDHLDLFDWMGRRKRNFHPKEVECVTMRPWDNFFWWLEVRDLPPQTTVEPFEWATRGKIAGAMPVKGELKQNNSLYIRSGAGETTVWLSPQVVDFSKRMEINVNGRMVVSRKFIEPDMATLLEDARTRGDRQHPFWAKIVSR